MKNYFGNVYRYVCILPTNIAFVTMNLIDKSNHIKYIEKMKYNNNRFILYSLDRNKESDMNLDNNENHNLTKNANMNLDKIPLATQLLSFCILFHIKIKQEIYFFLNSLCIVYGLQVQYFNQESSTWHTHKVAKTFLSHTPFSIQVTDILFPIKPILKDIRHVLIGPILIGMDFISLSKLKNYLYDNLSGFVRWISLMFQTFVLQIDEDGEEVLMKIQEFDVFRQQKPGAVPFFKRKIIYNEDYTFLNFRNLKRKTYLFFRMVILAIVPFIIYRTNQKLHFESGLSKIAYIVFNLNEQKISKLYDKSWENVLRKNTLREFSINANTNLNGVDFSNLVKPRDSDQTRIINLWNANNLVNQFPLFTNHSSLKNKSSICLIDSLLFDQNHMHGVNTILQKFEKKIIFQRFLKNYFFQYLNEDKLSTIVYNYVLFLIKPRDILYKTKNNTDTEYISTNSDAHLIREKYFLINKIHNLQYKYFHINTSLFQKYFENKYFQKFENIIFLIKKKISLNKYTTTIFTNFFYKNKNHLKYNIKENNLLKKEIQEISISYPSFVYKVSEKNSIYRNVFIALIETYIKDVIAISQHVILNWLNISLGMSKNSFEDLHFQYTYINSLVDNNKKILFLQKKKNHLKNEILISDVDMLSNLYNDIKNIHLVKSLFYPYKEIDLMSQLEINLFKKSFFIQKWQLLDSLHSIASRNWRTNIIDDTHNLTMNIIPLFYSNFFNKLNFLNKSANFQKLNLRHETLQNFRKKLHEIISYEQDQINSVYDQSIQYFNPSNLLKSQVDNTNNRYQQVIWNEESQVTSINSILHIGKKSLSTDSNLLYTLNDTNFSDEIYPLNSSHLWQSLVEIFKKNVQLNYAFRKNNDLILSKTHAEKIFLSTKESKILSEPSKNSIFNEYIYHQIQIIRQYSLWFFTPEWWSLVNISSKKILLIIWQDILDSIYCGILPIKAYLFNQSNIFDNKLYEYRIVKDNNLVDQRIKHINIMIFEKLQKSLYNVPLSIWENAGFSSFRIHIKSYLASVSSFIAYYGFSLLLGGSSIILWMMFEKVRELTHVSWNTELDILVLANIRANTNPMLASYSKNKKNQLREQYNLSFFKWSAWLRLLFSNQIGSKLQNIWLYNRSTLDVYGDRRGLAFELMVGETSSLGLNLSNLNEKLPNNIGYESLKQEGLDYLKQLTNPHYKWYNNKNRNLIHNQRFISYAFYKTHSASVNSWQIDNNLGLVQQQYLPISLQLSDLYSRAILLIGPKDTGKSYLVKSLAADANLPLMYIPIDKLIDVLEFEESTLESDSSLYFLRENILKFHTISRFIKTMGPCIIWMPTIENIHNSWNYTSKTREHCTLLILRFLLKDITTTLANYKDIMFLASCENTSYLDPGFISVKRFNRFINLRIPSNVRRPQIFANFLKNHNLHIKSKVCWYSEFSNSTMGFNLRDLATFANQAFLISLDKNKQSLELEDIRLVLYRGLRANENSSKESLSQDFGKLQYKIGRAIVQTTLVQPHPMIPLRSRYDLWKPRFYFLSKAYLQTDFSESTVTQFDILPHILNCLAGSAAKDAWLLLNKTTLKEDSFYLSTEISHDLDLAVNLFESIFKEFAYLDICNCDNKNTTFVPEFKKVQNFVILDQGNDVAKKAFDVFQTELDLTPSAEDTLSQRDLEYLSFDIGWSSRIERLSLSRNILFDLLKKVDEPLSLFSYLRFFGRILSNDMLLEQQRSYAGIYHRAWDMMKSQIPKDLDYAFYGMLSKQRITTMGLPVLSNEFIEYEAPENDLLLFGGRPVWNPAATFLRNLVFRQRQLFANEELLSILYLSYQSQRSRPSIGKINRRKEVWTPDAYLETLAMKNNLEEDSEQKKRIKMTQTFNMFKRLAHANATFRRPQAEVPDNSEMPFIKSFIAPNRFSRFSFTEDIFSQQNLLKEDDAKLQELLTYGSILETYHYLLKLFIKHQYLLKSITTTLLKEGVLFEEDLQKIIHSCLNSSFNH